MRTLNQVVASPPWRQEKSWIPELHRREISRSLGIYPKALFIHLVRYERLRCDRLNAPLSLVVIPVSARDGAGTTIDGETACNVVSLLVRRVRSSDSVGWLDSGRVAVLLPATALEGARRFVALLLSDLPRQCTPVEISTYPQLEETGAASDNGGSRNNGTSATVTHDGVTHVGARPAELVRAGQLHVYETAQEDPGPEVYGLVEPIVAGVDIEHMIVHPVPPWKRVIDIAGAVVGLAFCIPVFLLVTAHIKLVSPGPVLFSQQRVGRGGRLFTFYKFRSMHCHNDESIHTHHAADFIRKNGAMTKLDEGDPRIIPGGRILRVLCIDELPQLYNVLRGDMSLVGPRPCIPYEAAEYQRWHRHRFSILPGLTGLWQVSGKNRLSFAEMIKLDIAYERTMSPVTDLVIILRTIPTIFGLLAEAIQRRLSRRSPEGSGEGQEV